MNAKEISDATLPAVTPADNDLMLIYDTSEGTTGKAPIAAIAPKVAENISISSISIPCSIKGNINLVRYGKIVQMQYFQTDLSTFSPTELGAWKQIAQIPLEYRPLFNIYAIEEGSSSNGRWQIEHATGRVMFYRFSEYGWDTALNLTWITN